MTILALGAAVGCSAGTASIDSLEDARVKLRLGYIPNVTHAQPIVGLRRGMYQETLGTNVALETKTFNAGPSVIEAIFAGALDAAYVGPNPAISGYIRSNGQALRIVAGATSGGALFIVQGDSGIETPADLSGKKIATPQLGNTQDVALRAYLLANGLASRENGGDVAVIPTANANILTLFLKGDLDGAWVPEPWATRLIKEANGRAFLDERTLWPNGDFATTQLIVRAEFLRDHPDVVKSLLRAHVETTLWINANQDAAAQLTVDGIKDATGVALPLELVTDSWRNLRVTYEPIAASLDESAAHAFEMGFLGTQKPDLANIYDLALLNEVLQEQQLPAVSR